MVPPTAPTAICKSPPRPRQNNQSEPEQRLMECLTSVNHSTQTQRHAPPFARPAAGCRSVRTVCSGSELVKLWRNNSHLRRSCLYHGCQQRHIRLKQRKRRRLGLGGLGLGCCVHTAWLFAARHGRFTAPPELKIFNFCGGFARWICAVAMAGREDRLIARLNLQYQSV